jgi:hypothetical protein
MTQRTVPSSEYYGLAISRHCDTGFKVRHEMMSSKETEMLTPGWYHLLENV